MKEKRGSSHLFCVFVCGINCKLKQTFSKNNLRLNRTRSRCHLMITMLLILFIAIFAAMSVSNAATISGFVFKEDGSNPVNDAMIVISVIEGRPCGTYQVVAQSTTSNGSFVIAGLSPGIYYLRAEKIMGTPDYVDEWWAGTGSIWDCWGAEAITINSSEVVLSNKNFQLDLYGSISGSLYDAIGNPIEEYGILDVSAFRGSSCENSKYIGAQTLVGHGPQYTIDNVPPGTYYVRTHNKGYVWYVDEFHTISGSTNNGVSYLCASATQVTVNSGMDTINIDLQLDSGGRISGTVFKSDGSTPITDADIRVNPYEGSACNGDVVGGTMTSNGNYIIAGLPAGGYYIQAFRDSGANYIGEWYSGSLSSYNCNDAVAVQVWVAVETQDILFQLDSGGSITGRLVDESGQPLGNVVVEYVGENPGDSQQAWSDPADGTFTLSGLGLGHAQIRIISDPVRYLAGFRRNFYLSQGEHKDIGTLKVQGGSIINGMVNKNGTPLQDFKLVAGAKLTMAKVNSVADGTFSFVLPPGKFTINSEDAMDSFATVPQTVVVAEADIMTSKSIPTIAAYDQSNGDVYDGTVTINASPPTGAGVMVLSFMNDQEFDPNNWAATNPLSMGGFFDGSTISNPYQLVAPLDSTVQLMLGIYSELSDGNESFTLIESIRDVDGGGTYNFSYNNIGSTVDGYVTRNGEPVFWATVLLYREPGNEFVGFARTDHNGNFFLYKVPDGTYGVEVTAEDYDCVYKAPYFSVNDNLILSAIELGECERCEGDFDHDGDVDGSDLAVFAVPFGSVFDDPNYDPRCDFDNDGDVDGSDLAVFAADFGRTDCPH
jgi:hypothetical protein